MKKRILAMILCVATLLSLDLYIAPLAVDAEDASPAVRITLDGSEISELALPSDEKRVLEAEVEHLTAAAYQWQVLMQGDMSLWVNIYDKIEKTCEVSEVVLREMLDDTNAAFVRCVVTDAEGKKHYSSTLGVLITTPKEKEPEPVVPEQIVPEEGAAEQGASVFARRSSSFFRSAGSMARDGETEYVTVTIKYLDFEAFWESGIESAIFSPYVATIEKGSSFTQTVVSPTFLGFAPFYDPYDTGAVDAIETEATQVPLHYPNLDKSVEIRVFYKPIEVNFAIRYFFQNVGDDLYTENVALYHTDKEETGTIIADSYIIAHAGDYTGFAKMYHIPQSVAADGSTVFECYFDRLYYLMQFDMDGGYGVEPIYARYGTIFIVNDPVRHGYVFQGWDLLTADTDADGVPDQGNGVADELPNTIPNEPQHYRALWQTVNTTYTVAYWATNSKGDYEYLGSKLVSAQSGSYATPADDLKTSPVCGEVEHTHSAACYNTDPYLKFDAEKTGTTPVLVEGDGSTVVNVYYKHKTYTLRFYYAREKDGVYQVVGGTTWPFGYYKDGGNYRNPNDRNTTVGDALGKVTEWGNVAEKPEVAEAKQNRYTIDTIKYGDYTYLYLEFTAQYGANLSQLWPVDIFDPVPISGTHSQTTLQYAYFSAWNGEYKVKYTQDQCVKNPSKPNQTIKGLHLYLDEDVIYSPVDRIAGGTIEDGDLISFLGFWDNGANISWSVPKKYTYRLVCDDNTPGVFDTPIYSEFVVYDDSGHDGQTQIEIPGYTFVARSDDSYGYTDVNPDPDITESMDTRSVTFKYTRRKDVGVTYYNYGGVKLADVHATFGDVLSNYYTEYAAPPYPSVLEQNAYLFEGWYTTPQCLPVSRVDVTKETVPHYDVALYANWVPTTHKVNFFTTLDKMNAYEDDPTSVTPDITFDDVVHGNIVGSVENPVRTGDGGVDLIFAGWFYIDAGQKRAFSPLAMPINRDINVFADWSSHSPQPYRINYVLMNNRDVEVADPSTGFAYAGSTRTFQAKAGSPYNQLFDAYNEGYFPTIASHSITLQYEEDKENPVHNVHTFYYVQASNIKYTVRYVNKVTGEEMYSKTETTSQAVVTERFRPYPNMVPDAFYKRLVISVEKDEGTGEYVGTEDNEIIFYYMPNDTSAYYAVHFMQEKLHDPSLTPAQIAALQNDYAIDGSGGYEATATHLEGTGTIGDIESIIPQSFPGFELIKDHAVTVTGADGAQVSAPYKTDHFELTVTAEGTELYIFYRRMQFDYEVHYYKYNTEEPVDPVAAPSKKSQGFYNATVSADAMVIGGYTCVSATHQELLIRPDETQNVIVFYYAPVQYVVEYILVPDDGGWLSNTIEVKTGAEDFEGSIPHVNEFYEFGGWFTDAACTNSVKPSQATFDSATNKLVPIKSALSETESNKFYAKLIPRSGNLTIKRTDAADETQVFVYEIRNNATGDVIEVTVVGNGSVTVHNLLFGEYTVTQQNGWSWRYGDLASAVTHSDTGGTTVQFVGPPVRDQWLSDNSDLILNREGDTA